ncbi:endothelin-1 [Lissotriton helveticus]
MDIHSIVSLLLVICHGLMDTVSAGAGLPLQLTAGSAPQSHEPARPPGIPWRPRRVKRCSCSTLMDKECVYFCHLDIIWINTPEHTVPYGLGNARSRRSLKDKNPFGPTSRCQCTSGKDKKCWDFCQTTEELRAQSVLEKGVPRVNKEDGCVGNGLECVQRLSEHSKKMRRYEAIGNTIKMAFRIAKSKASLREMESTKQMQIHRKLGIWERLKKTS